MLPKMSTVARNATPAEAKLIAVSGVNAHVVKRRPSTVGERAPRPPAGILLALGRSAR
jgi:hypothetical protein